MRAITIEKEIIGDIEYELYFNSLGPAVRVFDVEAKEVVTIVNYPDEAKAQGAFGVAIAFARRMI